MNESATLDRPAEYRVKNELTPTERRIEALKGQAQAYNNLAAMLRKEARALELQAGIAGSGSECYNQS